jgi:hypothetical protein
MKRHQPSLGSVRLTKAVCSSSHQAYMLCRTRDSGGVVATEMSDLLGKSPRLESPA